MPIQKICKLMWYMSNHYFNSQPLLGCVTKNVYNNISMQITESEIMISFGKDKILSLQFIASVISNIPIVVSQSPFNSYNKNIFGDKEIDIEDYRSYLTLSDSSKTSLLQVLDNVESMAFMNSTRSDSFGLDMMKLFFILNHKVLRMYRLAMNHNFFPSEEELNFCIDFYEKGY